MKENKEVAKENKLNFIERLAEIFGASINAKYIYAEPVKRDGVTVIPVAKASYGLGGGIGKKDTEEGGGGGGGVSLTPVGYIELKDGESRYRPTRDWLLLLPILAVTAPVILLSLRGIKRLLQRN